MIGFLSTNPSIRESIRKMLILPREVQYVIPYIPPIVSRIALMLCTKGSNGYTALKNTGATSIGKVPPEPATCITRRITDTAFPISPKETVRVYIDVYKRQIFSLHAISFSVCFFDLYL